MKLTGHDAIAYAEANDLTLNKYTDPTEDAREGLSPDEARKIASEDPSLIWLEKSKVKLTVKQAAEAAHNLMRIVKSGQQWSLSTADSCLPAGWALRGAEDSDFHPCTIKTFTRAFHSKSSAE